MKKILQPIVIIAFLNSCNSSNSGTATNSKENKHDPPKVNDNKEKVDTIVNEKLKDQQPTLTFKDIYPKLKNSLLKVVCEAYTTTEEKNNLSVFSKETKMFLSSWEWDLKNKPLLVKDIDKDGLLDYTIELNNAGGGCGGQMGEEERWTLFGSRPDKFEWTHVIPYRSETGKWKGL
jgi:hypothetical protein